MKKLAYINSLINGLLLFMIQVDQGLLTGYQREYCLLEAEAWSGSLTKKR